MKRGHKKKKEAQPFTITNRKYDTLVAELQLLERQYLAKRTLPQGSLLKKMIAEKRAHLRKCKTL